MSKFRGRLAGLALLTLASVAMAQSPGSIESHFKYAKEYMEARSWFYAKLEYESILRKDPGNAEATQGYNQAKANYDAEEAAKAAQARAFSPARPQKTTPAPARRPAAKPVGRKTGAQSKRAMCDDRFGVCYAINKSIPMCAVQRSMCYTQNGVK